MKKTVVIKCLLEKKEKLVSIKKTSLVREIIKKKCRIKSCTYFKINSYIYKAGDIFTCSEIYSLNQSYRPLRVVSVNKTMLSSYFRSKMKILPNYKLVSEHQEIIDKMRDKKDVKLK